MSKLKFTEEMFISFAGALTSKGMADRAQKAFDEWLENQNVVYGNPKTFFKSYVNPEDTHKARLVCFEELKPCAHEKVYINLVPNDKTPDFYCKNCNKQLKPKNGWEIVNE